MCCIQIKLKNKKQNNKKPKKKKGGICGQLKRFGSLIGNSQQSQRSGSKSRENKRVWPSCFLLGKKKQAVLEGSKNASEITIGIQIQWKRADEPELKLVQG